MAKDDWQIPHSDMGDMKLKPFRDPITGEIVPQYPQDKPRPAGSRNTGGNTRGGNTLDTD